MIIHLGSRVSALLDGQLEAADEERAWAHAHSCPVCWEAIQREGWVKTQLYGLSFSADPPPSRLKGSLLGAIEAIPTGPSPTTLAPAGDARHRSAFAALSSGAVGVAVVGVLALGTAPAAAPSAERRPPSRAPATGLLSSAPSSTFMSNFAPISVLRPASNPTANSDGGTLGAALGTVTAKMQR